ncbi:MAG: Xaa-Pro peptidase family protein [candidate division Zixibacteria bacterium]|nr:Xaa-Pro peptidase family protein [candidate division Zixibacteria bacterium]
MHAKRLAELRKKLRAENLDGIIVTHLDYVRYLLGFTGTAGVFALTDRTADFLTDSRYAIQAAAEVKNARITIVPSEVISAIGDLTQLHGKNKRYGYSGDYVTISVRNRLQKALPEAIFIPADSILSELGWVKDSVEIASIKAAVKISDRAFERILSMISPGIRENELSAELEYQMAVLGSERPAFESIVASGHRSALPHGRASAKKIAKGDFITFDFGATVNGYVSDITRTVVLGKATSRQKKIYDTVLRAHLAGIKKVKAGTPAKDVDAACRDIITKAGYGKMFGHGTGHGIGFYIHTGPRVSSLSKDTLKANNVVTIEPGIYIEGWGGVRIEDDVLVTKSGGQPLNRAEKKLLEL